ncbi:unnamed protein product [Mytilus coruscus]|uniref:Uncharacterized protein n=1 Tax=Mytilus coruscus TaxID=42192 RepID=A0A6J8C503_MYTCO|nr:unnamed protein product [Mytilus coruscus]
MKLMARNRIQKLILLPEYSEFKDTLLAEAAFIELDKCGEPIRQVFLGISENVFILASENVPDYVQCPSIIYDADVDLDTDGMELEWIVPNGFLEINTDTSHRILSIDSRNGRIGHYLLSDIWGSARKDWVIWKEALQEIHDDPYSYTKCLFKDFIIPGKVYDMTDVNRKRSQLHQKKAKSLETLTNKVMTKMYEIQDEMESKKNKQKLKESSSQSHDAYFTKETGSQTSFNNDNDKKQKKMKKKGQSCSAMLKRFCFGGKAKQRPK